MNGPKFGTKKLFLNSSEKNKIIQEKPKENLKPTYENKEKNIKNNKSLFLVNKSPLSEEKKVEKQKNIFSSTKEKEQMNIKNYINNTQEEKKEIKQEENNNNIIKNLSNNLEENINKVNDIKNKEIKINENKDNNYTNNNTNNQEKELDNNNNMNKTTINNNFIINKDNTFMINTNLTNSNIINNNAQNPTINNNYNIGHIGGNSGNYNTNIINRINYNLNNNIIHDNIIYKDNNINVNSNIEKNNIINNIRFMRGNSVQPKNKNNSFLNNKHHLLENAIIKKEFQEPKRKVILKHDSSLDIMSNSDPINSDCFNNFQKIINLEESDSENDFSDEFEENEEYNEEDDEEYILNTKDENLLNNSRKRRGNSLYNQRQKEIEEKNPLYEELNDLIKKYDYDKIINCFLKIYNNEFNIKDKQIKDYDILKKISEILSKSNENEIHILLLKIISYNFNESQDKLLDLISKSKKPIAPIEITENSREISRRGRSRKILQNGEKLREKRRHTKRPSPPFYYGKHFFRKNNKIYCYVPKAKTVSFNRYTLYCKYRGANEKCMAKIIIHQHNHKISYIGNHICHPKMTIEDFYKKYPNIKESDWTHIQFAVKNGKPYIMSQY